MSSIKEYYIIPEDVFRFGDQNCHKLDRPRNRLWGHKRDDVDVIIENGVETIVANGKGISVFNAEDIKKAPLTGWVWKMSASTVLPHGLKLINNHDGHYMIVPVFNMAKALYIGMLQELGRHAARCYEVLLSR